MPGSHSEFIINAYGMPFEEITASSLVDILVPGTRERPALLRRLDRAGTSYRD